MPIIPGVVAASGSSAPPTAAPNDAIAWYKLEESASPFLDSAGSYDLDNGSTTGLTVQATGKKDYGISGSGAHTGRLYDLTPPLGSAAVTNATFIAWLNVTNLPASATDYVYEQVADPSGDTNFRIWIDTSGYISFRNFPGGTATSTSTISTGTWFQLAVVLDGTDVRFYFDTTAVGVVTIPTYTGSNTMNRAGIMNHLINYNRPLDGTIDEVIIYNYGLTSTEVTNAYNRVSAGYSYY